MEKTARAFYENKFELEFLKSRGGVFQDFFSTIMEKCHPGDFVKVKAWGNIGDRKSDGYLKSERKIFQVYAPNELTLNETIKKIDEDFEGAKKHWKSEDMKNWTFVHNSKEGISADILRKLLELEKLNPNIKIEQWGFEELRKKIFGLSDDEISSVLGFAPTDKTISSVGFKELKLVFEIIAKKYEPLESEIKPVPKEKIKINKLSQNVEILIKAGMRKSKLVDEFFNKWPDPEIGDKIANAFKNKYTELKKTGMDSDIIFANLLDFAEESSDKSSGHRAAALAVISYLFENCDIFEGKNDTSN